MWIKFRVCLAIIAQLLLPSREVASREINCHARRSRDKRINSSRNEADKNCLRSRLLNYGRDIIRLPRLWRKVQRFLLLFWAKNFNEFCNLRIQRNDLTYSLWRRERRRKNWKWLSRDGVKSRAVLAPVVNILSIFYILKSVFERDTLSQIILEVYDPVIVRNLKSIEPPIPRKICINFRYPPPPPPPP